jgi:hypothetical protein
MARHGFNGSGMLPSPQKRKQALRLALALSLPFAAAACSHQIPITGSDKPTDLPGPITYAAPKDKATKVDQYDTPETTAQIQILNEYGRQRGWWQ